MIELLLVGAASFAVGFMIGHTLGRWTTRIATAAAFAALQAATGVGGIPDPQRASRTAEVAAGARRSPNAG